MGKRNYTHVQELLPEIEAMLGSGKTQREVAEYFGFRDKYVVKSLVKRERAKQRKRCRLPAQTATCAIFGGHSVT